MLYIIYVVISSSSEIARPDWLKSSHVTPTTTKIRPLSYAHRSLLPVKRTSLTANNNQQIRAPENHTILNKIT